MNGPYCEEINIRMNGISLSCSRFYKSLLMRLPGFLIVMVASALASWPVLLPAGKPEGPGTVTTRPVHIRFTGEQEISVTGEVTSVTLPLKRAGRLLLLEGTLDNTSGNFILDTGSSELVLNETYFRGPIRFNDEEGGGVTGETGSVSHMIVKELSFSELVFRDVSADVIPLGHLENRRGVRILGLLGMSLLKNMEISIDIEMNELQLSLLDKTGSRLDGRPAAEKCDIVQPVEMFRNIIFVKAAIGGKELDFCLDTGAESNVLCAETNKKVLSKVTISRRANLSGSGQGQGEVLFGTLTDFSMGGHSLSPMETIVCCLASMEEKYGYAVDGMLGYDFFAKGRIVINPVKQTLCLRQARNKEP